MRGDFLDQAALILGNGTALAGWTSVRVTRGIERMPSDFGIGMTERFTDGQAVAVSPGDPFTLMLGMDVVMTGYVDSVTSQLGPEDHSITVAGRSKCADLVDCSAEWPGFQILNSNLQQIATQLVKPYQGLEVLCDITDLPTVQSLCVMLGETPWSILERIARFSAALVYDNPDGNLVLTRMGTVVAAGGFVEGQNVEGVTSSFSMVDRFSEYIAVQQAIDMYGDLSAGSLNVISIVKDTAMPRHRRHIIIAENLSAIGLDVTARRATWEMNRRTARGAAVTLTTDSWRDADGKLWTPNTKVHVTLPTVKVANADLLIGEVTYRLDDGGTHADLVLMPPEAFAPEPYILQPQNADIISANVGGVR
jgi:prophage tail gpP-like protein